ncbi:MAG TPA: hypothetical protein VG963_17440 [Polyangiaceae bacterium]|nr:hypothetical protein [Polyangiaceae bacterium]
MRAVSVPSSSLNDTLSVVDTRDPAAPAQLTAGLADLPCLSFEVAGDAADCAVGDQGVEVVDLSSLRSK